MPELHMQIFDDGEVLNDKVGNHDILFSVMTHVCCLERQLCEFY